MFNQTNNTTLNGYLFYAYSENMMKCDDSIFQMLWCSVMSDEIVVRLVQNDLQKVLKNYMIRLCIVF